MRVVGQSTIVSHAPYVHLGYLAATYTVKNRTLQNGGIAALAIGLVMALLLARKAGGARGGLAGLVSRGSERRARVAIALILLGCVGVGLASLTTEERAAVPPARTCSNGYDVLKAIADARRQGRPVPKGIAALGLSPDDELDGWFRPMRIVAENVDGGEEAIVVSAGADGIFGTPDDIHMSWSGDGVEAVYADGSEMDFY